MNQTRQRIVIARMCGWKSLPKDPAMIQYTAQKPDGKWDLIPDFPNDLNAVHVAEKLLNSVQELRAYRNRLMDVLGHIDTWRATATQRSEALLKTLGLWEEDTPR